MTRKILKLPTKGEYVRPDMGGWAATTYGGHGSFTIDRNGSRIPAPELVAIWNQTTGTCVATPTQPGDRLWVREAFSVNSWGNDVATIFYRANEYENYAEMSAQYPVSGQKKLSPTPGKWRRELHLPRWASRLTLIVTDVKVEQVQNITPDDVTAEGIETAPHSAFDFQTMRSSPGYRMPNGGFSNLPNAHRKAFQQLWGLSHGDLSWDKNPWVEAISFHVVKSNIENCHDLNHIAKNDTEALKETAL